MIKTGEMTPFGTVVRQEQETTDEAPEPKPSDASKSKDISNLDKQSVADNQVKEDEHLSKQTNGAHGFDDDDLYDAEIEEPGSHSDRDNEWLPSDQDKGSHSNEEEMAVDVTGARGELVI